MGMLAWHVNWLEYYLENELRVNHLRDFGVTPGNGNTVTGFIWPQKKLPGYQVSIHPHVDDDEDDDDDDDKDFDDDDD